MPKVHDQLGTAPTRCRLSAASVTLGYRRSIVAEKLSVDIPDHAFTAVIGPNACGKSTLMRSLARLLTPHTGEVLLDGKSIHSLPTKDAARQVGLLAQTSSAPDGILVHELVSQGRYPYLQPLRPLSKADKRAVANALAAADVTHLADRPVDELSGGQRQRVWLAMTLAQETQIVLLDEPTTYLDITHQVEMMELFRDLHAQGRTLVAVLHDLNHAARYATHVIAMRDGRIVAQGAPSTVISADLIREVFDLRCTVIADPIEGSPMVVPLNRPRRSVAAGVYQ